MENVTGIILAGGKSSRMNYFPKGLLKVNGKSFIQRTKETLQEISENVLIISNNPFYNFLGCPTYQDLIRNEGPLGGLITGLVYSTSEINLVTTCDMPFTSTELFMHLLDNCEGYDAVIPYIHERPQPLCGLYRKNALNLLGEMLRKNTLKMEAVINHLNTNRLEVSHQKFYYPEIFYNINSLSDLNLIYKKHEG